MFRHHTQLAAGRCPLDRHTHRFDHVDNSQRFFGLKRMMLHASLYDTSLMRERLAYSIFR